MVLPLHDDNPTTIRPYVTVGIIVACALVYLVQHLLLSPVGAQQVAYALGVIPAVLTGREGLPPEIALLPPPATIFTSMFLHAGFLHLAGNMWFLWIFGNNVEDAMGHVRFLIFYVLCGVVAVFSQVLPNPGSIVPMVGASGAISGVLGAYMLLYPRARVLLGLPVGFLIIQLGRFPAVWVLAAWFVLQLVHGKHQRRADSRRTEGRIAFGAHIGGFVAGLCSSQFSNAAAYRCGGITETLLNSAHRCAPRSRLRCRDQGSFLAETIDSQVLSAEQPGSIRVIARAATNIAAFIGRALKGPVNEPVPVRSFADYTRVFGGLWQPSTLSYAVEQFFENGGRCAVIVRVVNGARPPTLTLPTTTGKLILRGVGAGSREFLRASVDYDAIDAKEQDRFNLVVQRVRTAGSEQIEDQEIFRRLSITPGVDRFVADALLDSRLVRVQGSVPTERPARTPPAASGAVIGYTPSNPDGDDGGPITDYDVIGSAQCGPASSRSRPRRISTCCACRR